jgi:ribonucleotide monophosphatase NagD (HAD superfamily)
VDFTKIRFCAIFVFHDPRNWALDGMSLHPSNPDIYQYCLVVQIVCDIIQSGGLVNGPDVHSVPQTGEPVELVFCNPDLIWRSDFERPRLGQGAFKEAFQAVYKVRGRPASTECLPF